MTTLRAVTILLAAAAVAADYSAVRPTVFPADDPRGKDLPTMVARDLARRMREANERESQAFAAVTTRAEWERHRDARLVKLRASLGAFPDPPKDLRVEVTRSWSGDGFVVRNLLYETRPGLWVSANLYLPEQPPARMPGVLISHSHHAGKADGELQDMGMTWARSGVAVLVPDHLGHGERRQHAFRTPADFDRPFRAGRQDYYFRYNANLQLSAVGESLMGWLVWDLMRGVDVLLKQPTIDRGRVILLGAVAGGGDPAGVTAALDPRIACVAPFNFGGWQPESRPLANPDRDFDWFGDGYWESTRGLRGGAAGGFAHYVIVGAVAPRKLLYGHEFAWDAATDPAWPRLRKVFDLYGAKDALRVAHGRGSVKGQPPDSTHCNQIGDVHRRMVYQALRDWFGMPVPEEYSRRRPAEELTCWTEEARRRLRPKYLHEVVATLAEPPRAVSRADAQAEWARRLGGVEPVARPTVVEAGTEPVPGGTLARFALATDPGITVPLFVLTPKWAAGKRPVVVMVASGGKQAFLKGRGDVIADLLDAGVVVCLADVRGTGETRPGSSADRGSSLTSVSQTSLILGQPVLGAQLRDLRTVLRWLQAREGIDGKRLAVWGDSFAPPNAAATPVAVPLDVGGPVVSEPGGATLALLAALFEADVVAAYARGGLAADGSLANGPDLWVPHDAVVPARSQVASAVPPVLRAAGVAVREDAAVTDENRLAGKTGSPAAAAAWVIDRLVKP